MAQLEKWRGRSALVVDDSRSNRIAAVQILESLGLLDIHEAENGLDALDQLQRLGHVDLILTDLNMPHMDGIELLGTLAKSVATQSFFIAVMSSVSSDVLDAVQGIADASSLELLTVLPKPVRLEDIRRILDTCDPELHQSATPGVDLDVTVAEVEAALNAGLLIPYFQPKVSIPGRKLMGVEALVRWNHPVHGILSPALFVQHLEQGDIALRFFYQFLSSACSVLKGLLGSMDKFHCSINLPVPLLLEADLVEKMEFIMQAHGLKNHAIVLELTETTLMSNLAPSLGTLARLRMKGFGIAMDDYGTGYSSMKQLSCCPFSEIKIDREFVHDAVNSNKKLAILTAAIEMCRRLNLVSVAEGVETEADWQQLEAIGCDLAQGYFISRPLSAEKFIEWLSHERKRG